LRRLERSGSKNIEKLKTVVKILVDEQQLGPSLRDHRLKGDFKDHGECHIEPDWLLIYKIVKAEQMIIFERTGSHSDLFE
jgi:mRNA interferase YafQ